MFLFSSPCSAPSPHLSPGQGLQKEHWGTKELVNDFLKVIYRIRACKHPKVSSDQFRLGLGEPPSSPPKPRQGIREEGRSYGFKNLALVVLPLTKQILQPKHLLRSKSPEVRTPGYVSGPALPRHGRAPSPRTSSGCTQSPSSRPPRLFQAQCSCRSPCDPHDPSRQ